MNNNKFLEEIQKESKSDENNRKINSQNDIIELIMKYNRDNKKLKNELLIMKFSEFNEFNLDKIINL